MRILVTSAGKGTSNNVLRSLRAGDPTAVLVGCHANRFELKLSPAERNVLIDASPTDEDPLPERFERAIRHLVGSTGFDLLIPGNDRDARAIARMHAAKPIGCRVFLPAPGTIETCQDKLVLNALLARAGIPVAQSIPVGDFAGLRAAWDALGNPAIAWCRIRRGSASRGATMVRDPDQAWAWIQYWHTMRGVPVDAFTLCAFLPGRDFNVQGIWKGGRPCLVRMCERLSYLNAEHHPSGMASTPAIAKTLWDGGIARTCEAALRAVDPTAEGVFNVDLKQDADGIACVTEINAGRFAMITPLYDAMGTTSMVMAYVRIAMGEAVQAESTGAIAGHHYLIREIDSLPLVVEGKQMGNGIERLAVQ